MADVNIGSANIGQVQMRVLVADPAPPGAGFLLLYAKSDGVYAIDSDSNVYGPFDVGGGGGGGAFTDLTDVPSSYSGQVGKSLVVNATEDGLEFSDGAAHAVVGFGSEPSIADATPTVLTWGTLIEGSDTIADISGNPTRFTLPTNGAYAVGLNITFSDWAASPSRLAIEIYMNGGFLVSMYDGLVASDDSPSLSLVTTVVGNAADYVEFYVTQETGGARTATFFTVGSIRKF